MTSFKSALHQQLTVLFGQVYSGLTIDLLHYQTSKDGCTTAILRVLFCDLQMVLQALSCLSAIQGHRCTVETLQHSPLLFLLDNKAT